MADLKGVPVVCLNLSLGPKYFMGKFMKKSGKLLKTNPLLMDLSPSSNQRTIGPENAHLKPDPGVHVLIPREPSPVLGSGGDITCYSWFEYIFSKALPSY